MSRLGKILLLVCLLDLAVTLPLITFGIAVEANPFLNYYFTKWGATGLVVSKMWLVLIPIFVLEIGQRACPYARKHISLYYKMVIWSYATGWTGANLVQLT